MAYASGLARNDRPKDLARSISDAMYDPRR
jgi:hypothetical protein